MACCLCSVRDTIHALRSAYADARKLLKKQNSFCASAEAGLWGQIGALGTQFPDDLELEALVDVLRGRFKVHTHCYEAVDIDALVQLSNEFKFPLAAIHHAAEAYLVPDVLKKAYKAPPAIALFASQGRYKRESYRGSEFAPKILHEHGIRAVMKSDHPMANGRFLLYEAQQAFLYGLPADVALASVTTTAASVLGLDHRLGSIRTGLDADVVIWDSHPLALGATPRQVYIDGIPQLKNPAVHEKPATFQDVPKTPDFGEAARQTVEYDGLPPLAPNSDSGIVAFLNVAILGDTSVAEGLRTVLVDGGQVVCSGPCVVSTNSTRIIDLRGGVLVPGLISFGAPLGLHEIESEPTTSDGIAPDAINGPVSALLGGDGFIARAVDALALGGRNALLAYRSGVTHAITAQAATFDPDFVRGLSTAFSLGATHRLQQGAIVKELVALHILIERGFEQSVSTRISALRRLLLGAGVGDLGDAFKAVSRGELPLVVDAFSADIIASVLDLKAEVEMEIGSKIRLVISHGHEAHLLASQLGKAGVGVILTTARPFPLWWSMSRMMPGPPLTEKTAIQVLLEHNVTVALGVDDAWDARNTRFNVAWAALDAGGAISQGSAFALASSNLEKLFGVEFPVDLVAYDAGDFWSMSAKPVAIISSSKGCVDVF
ncbi:hypothetical protein BKA62DRAFT_348554 [Auriculariales sp. MPI-PUGE-AT-0066]|nr:hypothetical protein BKA62DRAFT_348554 [Auriculariales sp. MPI-PUGE-AT-0066]